MDDLPDSNRDEAARWLANVEDDLRALDAVLRDNLAPSRIACFLAHLAVEKALKATLIDAGIDFAKTHDVTALHRACIGAGRLLDLDPAAPAALNPWAIDGRYADDLRDASRGEATRFADLAHTTVATVRRNISDP